MSIATISDFVNSGDSVTSTALEEELVAEEEQPAHAYLLENPHKVEIREQSFLTEEEKKTGDFGIDVTLGDQNFL